MRFVTGNAVSHFFNFAVSDDKRITFQMLIIGINYFEKKEVSEPLVRIHALHAEMSRFSSRHLQGGLGKKFFFEMKS